MDQVKQYDAVVIGAGLSGLTAASLLGKRGLRVAVVEHHRSPGGSCGAFKRGDALFDQGSAMLFGFGEEGFNAHRFVFNCLEEPFTVLKHKSCFTVSISGGTASAFTLISSGFRRSWVACFQMNGITSAVFTATWK